MSFSTRANGKMFRRHVSHGADRRAGTRERGLARLIGRLIDFMERADVEMIQRGRGLRRVTMTSLLTIQWQPWCTGLVKAE